MLLMSWGGERRAKVKDMRSLQMEICGFEDDIERLGVRHNDIISDDMLWNDEVHEIMFIDFESSTDIRGRALQEVSNNRHNVLYLRRNDQPTAAYADAGQCGYLSILLIQLIPSKCKAGP